MLNIVLAAVKFVVGIVGASQAVIADAVHSLSDLATDFAVLFGVKYWSAPPDENHPYGHRRIEAMVTMVIALLLAGAAVGIAWHALVTIREKHYHRTLLIAMLGPVLSIFCKEILYRWTVRIGRRIKSSALVANAWHHRSDALSSIPAVIAVAVASTTPRWTFIDHIGALIISLFILKVAWDIICPPLMELTDCGASPVERELISDIAAGVSGVREIHALRTRKVGPNLQVDLHILVDPDLSVRTGHEIAEEVKHRLIDKGPEVLDVVVHLEPDDSKQD